MVADLLHYTRIPRGMLPPATRYAAAHLVPVILPAPARVERFLGPGQTCRLAADGEKFSALVIRRRPLADCVYSNLPGFDIGPT